MALQSVDPYSTDSDSTTFNTDEQATIVEAWRQITAYFAMFDVNVTTVQPNVSTTPTAWLVVGNNISGGRVTLTFLAILDLSHVIRVAMHGRDFKDAHEIGHNFGNHHTARYDNEGNKTAEYHGAFDALHGPLMGLDYRGVIHKWTTWHRADQGVTALQDDMWNIGVISSVWFLAAMDTNQTTMGTRSRPLRH